MKNPDTYAVELTVAQWDLVVCSLNYVYERADFEPKTQAIGAIDKFCRRFYRRRANEIIAEIQSCVPDAGTGDAE